MCKGLSISCLWVHRCGAVDVVVVVVAAIKWILVVCCCGTLHVCVTQNEVHRGGWGMMGSGHLLSKHQYLIAHTDLGTTIVVASYKNDLELFNIYQETDENTSSEKNPLFVSSICHRQFTFQSFVCYNFQLM